MFGFDVRAAKVTWTVFLVALLLFVAYLVSSTLLVVVFAVFFSYLLYPLIELADRFRPKRISRTVSIGLSSPSASSFLRSRPMKTSSTLESRSKSCW